MSYLFKIKPKYTHQKLKLYTEESFKFSCQKFLSESIGSFQSNSGTARKED